MKTGDEEKKGEKHMKREHDGNMTASKMDPETGDKSDDGAAESRGDSYEEKEMNTKNIFIFKTRNISTNRDIRSMYNGRAEPIT